MAITNVIENETAAVDVSSATEFTISFPTTLLADYFAEHEYAVVYRLGPSGSYLPATNKEGAIVLSAKPNIVLLDAPATYKVAKTETALGAYVGYIE